MSTLKPLKSDRPDTVREQVSEMYTAAVERSSCCSPKTESPEQTASSSCCGTDAAAATKSSVISKSKGVAVQSACYEDEALTDLPEGAVENAFGCGNPVAFSEVQPGETVIDLGSGAGMDLLLAAKKVGPSGHVIGIDMTDAMIDKAKRNIAEAGCSEYVEVRQGIIEAMPVEDGSADWVISNCVINLSPEKDRVFAEIERVLKPGGRMIVSDIVAENLPAHLRESKEAYCSCIGGAISEAEYLQGLRDAGLVDVEVRARHVYQSGEIKAVVDSELAEPDQIDDEMKEKIGALAGSIASITVYARKP